MAEAFDQNYFAGKCPLVLELILGHIIIIGLIIIINNYYNTFISLDTGHFLHDCS